MDQGNFNKLRTTGKQLFKSGKIPESFKHIEQNLLEESKKNGNLF